MLRPARLKYLAEDKSKNNQHEQRAQKNPQHAKHGAPVAQQHIALDELPKQVKTSQLPRKLRSILFVAANNSGKS